METRAWCSINLAGRSSRWLEHFVEFRPSVAEPFNRAMADAAFRAFDGFGRASGHPAKLNFGDFMAYGVAAIMRTPLPFKGRDFGLTDVM